MNRSILQAHPSAYVLHHLIASHNKTYARAVHKRHFAEIKDKVFGTTAFHRQIYFIAYGRSAVMIYLSVKKGSDLTVSLFYFYLNYYIRNFI